MWRGLNNGNTDHHERGKDIHINTATDKKVVEVGDDEGNCDKPPLGHDDLEQFSIGLGFPIFPGIDDTHMGETHRLRKFNQLRLPACRLSACLSRDILRPHGAQHSKVSLMFFIARL